MEIIFNKDQEGNTYNIEMTQQAFEEYEKYVEFEKAQNEEFDEFLNSRGIKI